MAQFAEQNYFNRIYRISFWENKAKLGLYLKVNSNLRAKILKGLVELKLVALFLN